MLTSLGEVQAAKLAHFWLRDQVRFDDVYCGVLARQARTQQVIAECFRASGQPWPTARADGAWNEWYMVAGDSAAWLAEAQGFFAISTAVEPDAAFLQGDLPRLGELRRVGDRSYRVADIKQGTCAGSEGELPFRAPRGRIATYYDMIDDRGGFASIEDGAGGRQLYAGRYVAFDDLHLEGMRQIEGWSVPRTPAEPGRDPFLPPPA